MFCGMPLLRCEHSFVLQFEVFCRGYCSSFLLFFDVLPSVDLPHVSQRLHCCNSILLLWESVFFLAKCKVTAGIVVSHFQNVLPKRIFRETRLVVLNTLIISHMFPFAFSSCENEVPETWKFWSFSMNTGRRSSRVRVPLHLELTRRSLARAFAFGSFEE